MLTDFHVTCPHADCHWKGCLFPSGNADAWKQATPELGSILFKCPQCRREWAARLRGDDVINLPLSPAAVTNP